MAWMSRGWGRAVGVVLGLGGASAGAAGVLDRLRRRHGSAYGEADCQDCDGGDREGSFTGFLKLGGTLNDRVLLGVEGNAWVKEQDGLTLTLGSFTGTVTFYPQASSGFFLKGGVGLSYVDTEFGDGSLSVSASKRLGGARRAGLRPARGPQHLDHAFGQPMSSTPGREHSLP